jgi:uncharacterized protein with HEPN domain
MKDSDLQRIRHIKTYCEDVRDTLARFGEDFDVFSVDKDYSNSVSMSMMQIGELSVGLTDAFKNSTRNHIQWGALKGMRNLYAHAYISMNKSVIWESATRDVPAVLDFCESILMQFDEEQDSGPTMRM